MAGGLLAAGSCRQIVGIDDRNIASASSGAPACEASFPGTPACAACMAKSCREEAVDCCDDPSCSERFDCIGRCSAGDDACRIGCANGFGEPAAAVVACQAASCAADCGLACGGIFQTFFGRLVSRSKACADCIGTGTPCAVAAACGKDIECLDAAACYEDCPLFDVVCRRDCQSTYPQGKQPSTELIQSVTTSCSSECAIGQDWSCLGHVSWPMATTTMPLTFRVQVFDYYGGTPIPGATVKVCANTDAHCTTQVGMATTTDAQGIASFTIQAPTTFGFDGYADISHDGYYTTLAFPQPYITGDFLPAIPLLGQEAIAGVAGSLGVSLDPDRGQFVATVFDCFLDGAGGVSLQVGSADASSTPFYFMGPTVDLGAEHTDASVHTGGYLNLPEGAAKVTATVDDLGEISSVAHVQIRKGVFTMIPFMVPSP